ncbi:NAD(P)-binding protein [Annulohypoxylon maeteangense]|uniref:NAD(P)-binding protein n=1 Tax=Annulohypoxylon maeteangense TaxID=1927788 RepID=UPI0020073975|nr:NAD(P)-binding protein [Annulohypoxylon maeteangense]KAI0888214.1 NAD(P)-binding protein [Annulohypoxylon maeteangense]
MAATILITGASGLIGFRVLLSALAAGHNVRYTVRSEEKARVVFSNPAVQKLAPGDRLSPAIISDFSADGAFDSALRGVTHIVHAGSPVPVPTYDPTTEVFEPTVKITSGLLASALKTPTVQRVIITSSIVANLGLVPPSTPVTASTRIPLPTPIPSTFSDVFEGYITGKIVELHNTDEFAKTRAPHFTIAHVIPGYVFGRNGLALDAAMMQTQNSSNNFLMMGMVGGELPFPIHGGFVHIDDLADLHLRILFHEPKAAGKVEDFGVATKVDYGSIFEHVATAFPKAVEAGVFKRGKVPTLPANYKSSDVEELLGRKLRTFDTAVVDVASQYLETLGKDKA